LKNFDIFLILGFPQGFSQKTEKTPDFSGAFLAVIQAEKQIRLST